VASSVPHASANEAKAGRGAAADPRPALLSGLSVVLPCLNEQENILRAVREARMAAKRVSDRHEIIVVDDGSHDDTAELTAHLAQGSTDVRLVIHLSNRGYGAAVRTGIAAATMPHVLITDADLQFDLREIDQLVARLGTADVVVGRRLRRRDPPGRRGAASAWNALVCALYGLDLQDVDCAFKLFPRHLIQGLELDSTGALFSTELLVKSLGAGARIAEVAVSHYPRTAGRASGGNPQVVLRAFRELARLHPSLRRAARRG
jgi:glycosyltransferase involved in cell wall biosynthesis